MDRDEHDGVEFLFRAFGLEGLRDVLGGRAGTFSR
jgi:hypothetical protein